ncbi:MAG TPA: hypothetical protein VM557_00395 [Thermoanaerobaculia bacterium]|nr:hypothetical protein [Thermoanaerobaculia bacterium]
MAKIEVDCPDCHSQLVIDTETAQVIWHKAKESSTRQSFDAMVSNLKSSKEELAKKFDREMDSQKDRSKILDAKFREAMQRVDPADTTPMKNPLDRD